MTKLPPNTRYPIPDTRTPNPEIAIKVENLIKKFHLYDKHLDRVKELIHPLRKKYHNDFYALSDINFQIKKGEAVGIIGKNGAGKSTLLKILTGVLTPTSGSVVVNGSISSLLELGAGFHPEMTGLENIYFFGIVNGIPKKKIEQRKNEIIAFADIGNYMNQKVKTYSSGMYSRLAFAVAVHVDSEILIVDEVLSVGDIRFQMKCFKKLEEFRKLGKTFIFVSHVVNDIARLCLKTIWMDAGELRVFGNSKEIINDYRTYMYQDTTALKTDITDIETSRHNSIFKEMLRIPSNTTFTGTGDVSIKRIGLFDNASGRLMEEVKGGENVSLVFDFISRIELNYPWFLFQVIDKFGLRVTGYNSYIDHYHHIEKLEKDKVNRVTFKFIFPELKNDEYFLCICVAEGIPDGVGSFILHQQIEDAYKILVNSYSMKQKQMTLLKMDNCKINITSLK
jgi:ABC-type polysaccharide/polyol phosphate transport system ATPase subunit